MRNNKSIPARGFDDLPHLTFAKDEDVEAVAEAIELVDAHSSEHYARAALAAIEARGWRPKIND